jgi:hypothetical protein
MNEAIIFMSKFIFRCQVKEAQMKITLNKGVGTLSLVGNCLLDCLKEGPIQTTMS